MSKPDSVRLPRVTALRQRLLKYLKRLVILLVILGALGVGAFTWLCYWPLEGSVDDMLYLVPEDAEFVLRGDWDDIEGTGWIQKNVLEEPLAPFIKEGAEQAIAEARAQIQDIEGQINANIPVEWAKFGVKEDVLRGETIVAGHWCKGLGPDRSPVPTWQEILVMTRVSWKTRCVAALKHGFIRDQVGPNLEVTPEADDVFKLVFPYMPVRPQRVRSVCGGGFVIPPDNQWYLRRVDDVLAISNSKRMIDSVADLSKDMTGRGSFAGRPGFDIQAQEGKVVAAINVQPLHNFFKSAFHYYPQTKGLRRFVPPESLEKLSGYLSLRGDDLIEGGAKISYFANRAGDVYQNVYSLAPRPVTEGIATLVPAKDTWAVVSLRVDPLYLLRSLVSDLLTPGQQRLWERNIRSMPKFQSIDDLLRDLSVRIDNQAMIALARLSDEYDKIEYKEMYSDQPDAAPAGAVLVRIKESANQEELDEYMADILPLMGFHIVGREKRGPYTFTKCRLEQEMLDYAFVSPCFVLASDHLILTSNEGYMRRVLDAVQNPKDATLASDETFQQTMGALPPTAQVAIFVDAEKYTRIPGPDRKGAGAPGTRGHMWDERNMWVRTEKDARGEMIYEHIRF